MSSLMANGIRAASHAADDQSASRGKVAAEVLRYLRAVERGAARADNARTREIANLRIAAHVKKNRWVINLQQVLGIFRLGPVQKAAVGNLSNATQLFFSPLEGLLFCDGLRDERREMAGFDIRQ